MKTISMKMLALALLLTLSPFAQPQPPNNNFQPYTPTVVGGLPPNTGNLEQPVFVADRGTFGASAEASEYEIPSAEDMGFDQATAVPSLEEMSRFEPGGLIAVVGEEHVMIGDLVPPDKITPEILANPQFEMMVRKMLVEAIDRKAMAQRFMNDKVSGKSSKEREQARKHIELQTTKIFYQKVVPAQKEKMKCVSDLELQEKLALMGKSLWSLKREFAESTWAGEHMRESIQEKPLIELSEMQDYYADNVDSFRRPSRAKYQIMSAMFDKYSDREAAYQAIVEMWNDVFVGGAPFDAVAKRKSTGFHASEGGRFDWTPIGALKSKVIEKAIFEIPVRGLSQILEDSDGFHFIEVLERQNAFIQPFQDSQVDIRKILASERSKKQKTDFIKKIREITPVWTKWPSDIPGSKDLNEYLQ